MMYLKQKFTHFIETTSCKTIFCNLTVILLSSLIFGSILISKSGKISKHNTSWSISATKLQPEVLLSNPKILNKLSNLKNNSPSLKSIANSLITQSNLISHSIKEVPHLPSIITTNLDKASLSYYRQFNEITNLILKEEFHQALLNSIELSNNLMPIRNNFERLFTSNNIRIVFLLSEIKDDNSNLANNSWNLIQDSSMFPEISNILSQRQMSLPNYIDFLGFSNNT